jgi:hypothetical protein
LNWEPDAAEINREADARRERDELVRKPRDTDLSKVHRRDLE